MRAREPDQTGYVARDGVRVYYEAYGNGTPTILLMPTSPVVHSRHWKLQIPYLAHHYRVVTFDPRGNGLSDRPGTVTAYAPKEYAEDAVAVMDETDTGQVILAGVCPGVNWCVQFATAHPERVLGLIAIAPGVPNLVPPHPHRVQYSFEDVLDTDEGWAKQNRHYWRRDYRGYIEFHSRTVMVPEPHSTKARDDCVEWGVKHRGGDIASVLGRPEPAGDARRGGEPLSPVALPSPHRPR